MKILINTSNNLTGEKGIYDQIKSRYPGDRYKEAKHTYIPNIQNQASVFSLSLWHLRMTDEFKEGNIKELKFVNITYDENILIKKEVEGKYKIDGKSLHIYDINMILIPAIDHYFSDEAVTFNHFIETWLNYILFINEEIEYKEFKEKLNVSLNSINTKENKKTLFLERIERVYPKINDSSIINAGNEGVIKRVSNERIKKIISGIPKKKLEEKLSVLEDKNAKFNLESIDSFNEELEMTIEHDGDDVEFEYNDIIHPTASVSFKHMVRIMRQQLEKKIYIDDNKLLNFGKIRVLDEDGCKTNFFKVIFNDFGYSYIETTSEQDIEGFIRDSYYMAKSHNKLNCRNIINSARLLKTKEQYIDAFKLNPYMKNYFEFVKRKEILPKYKYLCELTNEELNDSSNKFIMTCNDDDISSMTHWRKTVMKNGELIKQVYSPYEGKVFKCDCRQRINKIRNSYEKIDTHVGMSEKLTKFNEATIWKKK